MADLPPGIGPIEKQARLDVDAMGSLIGGARATFAELSFALAAALDRAYMDEAAIEKVTAGSKVLLTLMTEVARTANASTQAEDLLSFLAEVRADAALGDTPDVGTPDAGRQGRPDLADAGQATDAAPAVHRGRGTGD